MKTVMLICLLFIATQSPAVSMQHNHHAEHRQAKDATGGIGNTESGEDAGRPANLIGVPCKQIKVNTQTKLLPDLKLIDHHGNNVNFYSDLIKGKVVVISFFFTSCTYICLRQGEVFSKLQADLGDKLGKEVFLISVTMDPETDTPERLKQWGEQYGVRSGWTLVTGKKEDMKKLVGHLTGDPLGKIDLHSSYVYIGNDKTNNWTTSYGLGEPSALARIIAEISR